MESSFIKSFYDTVEEFVQSIFKLISAFLALFGFEPDKNDEPMTNNGSEA